MARADYARFVANAKKRPPKDVVPRTPKKPPKVRGDWDTKQPRETMPGPNAPDPKNGNGVLPPKAARAGAYFLPGFGDMARAKNRQKWRNKHAFNPGRNNGGNYS